MSTLHADYALVVLGYFEIIILATEDGREWVSAHTANNLLQFTLHDRVLDKVQSILAPDFSFTMLQVDYCPEPIPCLSLHTFKRLTLELAIAGNIHAKALALMMMSVGLLVTFNSGFEVKRLLSDKK